MARKKKPIADQVVPSPRDAPVSAPQPAVEVETVPLVSLDEQPDAPAERSFPIVGIGASAGGLAAFEAFLKAMPADTESGIALILVQHLSPDHKSILSDLIKRYTRMQVYEVVDGMKVEPNCTYIIPPNHDMALLNGTLQLLEPTAPRGLRLPIDFFFRSLSQDQRERAICVVLSGTGSDGTLGVRAVKGDGGMVMVQDPSTAEYDGMPTSAINTGLVDYVLPPVEMAAQLISYVKHAFGKKNRPASPPEPKAEDTLKKICILLRDKTGHDFSQYKENTLIRRVERRMAINQVEQMDEYLRFLQQNTLEIDALFRDILIGVTTFFRDPQAFAALQTQVIPRLFASRPGGGAVRVWVCACSTGEEAYSIAILIQEYLDTLKQSIKVQIFATDIDRLAIEQARSGVYPASIAADISPERLSRFFVLDPDSGMYRISNVIRSLLVFSEQDVLKDPPFSKLDLISCRNLMIYMKGSLQKRLIPLFHYALRSGGVLFLGTSETVGEYTTLFTILDRRWKIYLRQESILGFDRPPLADYLPSLLEGKGSPRGLREDKQGESKMNYRELTEQALLQYYAQSGILVNGKGDILYIHGRTGMYLEPAPGNAGMNILSMAREGLRQGLSIALRKTATQKEPIRFPELRVKTNGDTVAVNLIILPLKKKTGDEVIPDVFLVVLEDAPPEKQSLPEQTAGDPMSALSTEVDRRIAALELELQAKDEYLQSTLEEMETSNEELTSTNEEMQSVNEELQSTIEEMETSKEELQSVNEELYTVNAELQTKVADLSRANNDMNNLLAGTGVGTLFVDLQFRISRFTPPITQLLNLIQTDVGRPVAHVVSNLRNYDRLVEDIKNVFNTLIPQEAEVQTKAGVWYLMRIRPYRTLENVIEGAVITFVDITDRKRAEEALREANRMADSIVATVRQPLVVLDGNWRVVSANRAFYKTFNLNAEKTLGRVFYELDNSQWDIPALHRLLENILSKDEAFDDFEVTHKFEHTRPRTLMLNARRIFLEASKSDLILLAIEDFTEHKFPDQTSRGEEAHPTISLQDGSMNPRKNKRKAEVEPSPAELDLRQRAEAKLGQNASGLEDIETLSVDQARHMLQELRVHQIELEMQNEELRRAQDELQASRGRYFDLYELAPVGYFTLNEKGIILEANLRTAVLLGIPKTALVKRGLSQFILPEDQDIYYFHHKSLYTTGESQACEVRMARKGSAPFWARLETTLVQNDAGEKMVCRTAMCDISEGKQLAEQALRESERKYYKLFSEMFSGCALYELVIDDAGVPIDYVTLEINKAFEVLMQVEKSVIIGQKASAVLPQDEFRKWLSLFAPVALSGKSTYYEMYSPLNDQYFEGTAYSPEKGKFAVIISDVSERKQAEQKLRESQIRERDRANELEVILNSVPAIVWIARDPECELITGNQAASKFLKMPQDANQSLTAPESERPTHFKICQNGKEIPYQELPVNLASHGAVVQNFEEEVIFEDGSTYYLVGNAAPLFDDQGKPRGAVAAFRDITVRKQTEQALQESERRFRLLSEATFEGIVIHDGGVVISANKQAYEMFGYDPVDVLGKQVISLAVAPEARDSMYDRLATRSLGPYESIGLKKDGTRFQVEIRAREMEQDGRKIRIAAIRDVTERKCAEDALRTSEARFSTVFHASPMSIGITRLKDNTFLDVNPAWQNLTGFEHAEAIGRTSVELDTWVDPAERDWLIEKLRQEGVVQGFEIQLREKSGNIHDVLISAVQIEVAGESCLLTMALDITERKHMENRLRESEQRFRTLFHKSPLGIGLIDANSCYVDANEAFCKMLGYTWKELSSMTVLEITHPNDQVMSANLHQYMITGSHNGYSTIKRYLRKTGDSFWANVTSAPVINPVGDFEYAIAIIEDITERKETEANIRRRVLELNLLNQIGQAFNRLMSPAEIIDLLYAKIGQVLDNRNLYIALYDETNQSISFPINTVNSKNTQIPSRPFSNGLTEYILRSKEPLLVSHNLDGFLDENQIGAIGASSRCFLGAPMRIGDRVLGVIAIQDYEREDTYDAGDVELITTIAGQAAIVLENAWLYGEVQRELNERKQVENTLRESRDRLAHLSHRLVQAQEQERRRIAFELHDEVGQTLTALFLALDGVAQTTQESALQFKADELRDLVRSLIAQVSVMSMELHPRDLDALGLVPGLITLFRRISAQTGIEVDFKHSIVEKRRFAPEIEISAYRIVQEALTNVIRHSGVKIASIRLQEDGDNLWIQVQDEGQGFDLQKEVDADDSLGLLSMMERAEQVGGRLGIDTAPGEGVNIICTLPLV